MIFKKQIQSVYRRKLFNRCDDMGIAFYFSAADFPGLRCAPFSFPSKAGLNLQGYFYSYETPMPGRLIVFDHGMGGGHRSYLREIEKLAKAGYLVFSYDHTGCMESEGESTNGLAQSLSDLDACLTALKQLSSLQGRSIAVMGHSWGAFSTMNICALHPDVTHVISMSGFVCVKAMVEQNFSGILKGYRKCIYAMESAANPEYIRYNSAKSLSKTNAKVLLIYSADDPIVKKEQHYDVLRQALSGSENVEFLLVDGKGHNPNYTADAAKYLVQYQMDLTSKLKKLELGSAEEKKAFVDSYDWQRMTAQDDAVWEAILRTLSK
ncbi:MAG: alpha/beta fold hydrolase [Oscillospiraceae bacterium]|nr:alpha/beta fold hydrolase [Oscillospiraceae bacterium]